MRVRALDEKIGTSGAAERLLEPRAQRVGEGTGDAHKFNATGCADRKCPRLFSFFESLGVNVGALDQYVLARARCYDVRHRRHVRVRDFPVRGLLPPHA